MPSSTVCPTQDIGSDYKSAQLKFLPALQFLKTHPDFRPGKAQWVMLVDDDTYVFSRNLVLTLDQFGAGITRYIGHVCPEAVVKKLNGGPSDDFVMGGGGSLLSRLALEKMDVQACINRQNSTWKHWQSDWMIGACAAEAGIKAKTDQRFHQWLSWEGPGPAREHNFKWAVTLHPAHPNHMHQLFALRADINDMPVLDAGNSPGDPENSPGDHEYAIRGDDSSDDSGATREDDTFDRTGEEDTSATIAIDREEYVAKSETKVAPWPAADAETPAASPPGEGVDWPAPALSAVDGRQESPEWLAGVSGRRRPPETPSGVAGTNEQANDGGVTSYPIDRADPPRATESDSTPAGVPLTSATLPIPPLEWTPRLMQQGAAQYQMPEPEQHAAAAHATKLELLDLEQKALQRSGHAPRHSINLVQKHTDRDTARPTPPGDGGPQTFVVVIK